MRSSTQARTSATQRQRKLRVESLESREMLSHPGVAAVQVASTQWAPSFVSHLASSGLGAGGYNIPAGSSDQLQTLPWKNVDQIRITFTEDVMIAPESLSVKGVNKATYVFSAFTYDSNTHTAVWTFNAPIGNDKLMLNLDATGLYQVRSTATGEALDGAWTNGTSTYPSGDSQGGTGFQFRISVLPGDVDADNSTSSADAAMVLQQMDSDAGQPTYDFHCDLDGSGTIAMDDYSAVSLLDGEVLPTEEPAAASSAVSTATTASEAAIVAAAVDQVMSQADPLATGTSSASPASASSGGSGSSVSVSTSGNSSQNPPAPAPPPPSGQTGGGVVVATPNAPPVITSFTCVTEVGDYWTLEGTVTDVDSPVAGDAVIFGGIFANLSTTVASDGTFSLTVEVRNLQTGTATAQAFEPNNPVGSNIASDWILVC
jgi:hypothetical protein